MKTDQIVVVALAIIGVAIVAVLVSQNSNTANVIGSIGGAFNRALGAALSPVVSPGIQ